jgi:D-aminoacyl-tRNA deacylase
MRIVLQRVTRASVAVDGETLSEIGPGLLALVGIGRGDTPEQAERLAEKVAGLRVFEDDEGKTNHSLADVGGEVLVVSQFTLYGDLRKGRRPSWTDAEDPTQAERQVERFADALESSGVRVGRGSFGAHMAVELVNDGPMTLILDTATLFRESRSGRDEAVR